MTGFQTRMRRATAGSVYWGLFLGYLGGWFVWRAALFVWLLVCGFVALPVACFVAAFAGKPQRPAPPQPVLSVNRQSEQFEATYAEMMNLIRAN